MIIHPGHHHITRVHLSVGGNSKPDVAVSLDDRLKHDVRVVEVPVQGVVLV